MPLCPPAVICGHLWERLTYDPACVDSIGVTTKSIPTHAPSAPGPGFIQRHWWQLLLAALAVGAASRGWDLSIAAKADRVEVQALAYRVERVESLSRQVNVTLDTLASLLQEIRGAQQEQSRDTRDIRTIVCRQAPSDSWCRR